MAPRHHSAMRHVAPTRVELGTRTIFNLLGPLSNPAEARRQLVGVFAPEWVEPMAEVLARSAPSAPGSCTARRPGRDDDRRRRPRRRVQGRQGRRASTSTPEDAGLSRAQLDDLSGGEPATTPRADARRAGRRRTARCATSCCSTAAAALVVAGRARRPARRRRARPPRRSTAGAARRRARQAGGDDQRSGADERLA